VAIRQYPESLILQQPVAKLESTEVRRLRKAEYIGKMNLYLSLLDRLEKSENENPSIGIILCADKDHLDVKIALRDINKPIGVAEYQLLLPQAELQKLILGGLNS
jgi:hypothetical protein